MIQAAVQRALRPGCFFVAPPGSLRVEHVSEETIRWEIFRGQLLEPAQTRTCESFEAWHVFLDQSGPAPLLSIRWLCEQNQVFVTRQIRCRGFEAYEDQPGVILSRPVEKWVSELVGTIHTAALGEDDLSRALEHLLYLSVVGTSRLPITSLETPLPAFSFGRLAYLGFEESDASQPWSDPIAFFDRAISLCDVARQAKALEIALRTEPVQPAARLLDVLAKHFHEEQRGTEWIEQLLRTLFNGVALSPYTRFADSLIGLILALADTQWFGPAAALDTLSYMLRNLCRHLTAFDLTLFHNFGANYPDALFLDALLEAYLRIAAQNSDLAFNSDHTGRLRRRALRQACLTRRHYEGHAVPDVPTSMGESARVLPAPFAGVPEEQITEVGKRRRKLFAEQTTAEQIGEYGRRVLERSLADLDEPRELRELGLALFLDRPLGVLKEPGEVDRTPLLSYEAFSRSIARRRIRGLAAAGWIDRERQDALLAALEQLSVTGVPVAELSPTARPGVVSIADAGRAAADFVLLRTTRGSLDSLIGHYDLQPLADLSREAYDCLTNRRDLLFVQYVAPGENAQSLLRVYLGDKLLMELGFPKRAISEGFYEERAGAEVVPLQVLQVHDSNGKHDLAGQSVWLKRKVGG